MKAGDEVIHYSLDRDVWEIRGQLLGEREVLHDHHALDARMRRR